MPFKNFRDESRVNYGLTSDRNLTQKDLQLGCLLRIADASEVMAKNHNRLIDEARHQTNRADRLQRELDTERRRSAALRGHIKRMKAKRPARDGERTGE